MNLYELLGLVAELLFLAGGIYIYLYAIGKIKMRKPEAQEKAEQFRQENHWWLRLLSLALIAMMTVNIVLHIMQLMG